MYAALTADVMSAKSVLDEEDEKGSGWMSGSGGKGSGGERFLLTAAVEL